MSYLTQDDIANNRAMQARIAQAVTSEDAVNGDADRWAYDNRRKWASAPGWSDAWEYAKNTHGADPEYDPGTDEAVITDGMILSQVQEMVPDAPPMG